MDDEHMIISSRQTSDYLPYPFFKRKRRISLYGDMLLQDFCMHFSIILRKNNDYRYFYKIDVPDNRLLNLLEYDNGMFLEYDLDKLLADNLADLLHYGKQDALFCAISAENMEHFIFLLEKLGFEVKQGKHIAVKVPGMKRFKRLDTISEDLCRESLEAMFRYGDASLAALVNRAVSLLPARKAVFSPYQRKYYARMYRLRLAEKKRFTYKSAYLYEQIRKMHELQEEYLVVVRYDVKSYGDLFRLKLRLQQVDEELCKAQQEMYRDRALQKRTCKTAEDLEFFEASEDDYRERLEQIKLQKKDNRKKLKAVERCLERDGSLGEAELEYRIPVGDMVDMEEVEKDEVPGNPYRVQEDVEVENTVLDDAVEADVITEPKFESVVDDELETEVETFAETAVTGLKTVGKTAVTNAESVVKTDIDVMAESIESGMQNDDIRQIYYRRRLTVEIWSILPGLSCLTR